MDRSSQHIFLLFALLAFYALGPLIILIWTLTSINYVSQKIESTALLGLMTTLATSPGAYTGVIHQMIVPVVAAVTAASFRTILSHSLARWLFIIPLATVFICLVDALLFASLLSRAAAAAPASGALSQFFLTMAGTLATYVMTLVGLQAAGASEPDPAPVVEGEPEEDENRGSLAWSQQTDGSSNQTTHPGAG